MKELTKIMPNCAFCSAETDLIWKENPRCETCRTMCNKCHTDSGIYFNVDSSCYVTGEELHDVIKADGKKVVIFDFHKVLDTIDPEIYNGLYAKRTSTDTIYVILSYVGSTTKTRIGAQEDMIKYKANFHFTCFRKKMTAELGTKGHLMKMLDTEDATLLDDNHKNCACAINAGHKAIQIMDDEQALKEVTRQFR